MAVYREEGEFDRAISVAQRAMDLDMISKFEGYEMISSMYSGKKDWDGEISICQKLLAISPFRGFDLYTYSNMGSAYFKKGNRALGLEMYQRAIALNPQDPTTYFNLGLDYVGIGDRVKAIENYQKAAKLGMEVEAKKEIDRLKGASERENLRSK